MTLTMRRPVRPRRRVPALGDRHGRRRRGARHRPVRPAQRAGEQGQHAQRLLGEYAASGRLPDVAGGTTAARCRSRSTTACAAALRELLGRDRRRRLRRAAGLARAAATDASHPAGRARCCCATAAAWRRRSATGRASCTRRGSYHKGGTADGVFLQLASGTPADLDDPRPSRTPSACSKSAQARGDLQALRLAAACVCCTSIWATTRCRG